MFVPLLYARAVTDSINQLITLCTQQAPGQKECDNALRELEVNKTLPPCDQAFTISNGVSEFQYKLWIIRRCSFLALTNENKVKIKASQTSIKLYFYSSPRLSEECLTTPMNRSVTSPTLTVSRV